jgi:hypothetical protein
MPRDLYEERRKESPGFDPKIEHMRLRDGFAGRAMEGLLGDLQMLDVIAKQRNTPFGLCVGEIAYEIADGMMQARKRRGEK